MAPWRLGRQRRKTEIHHHARLCARGLRYRSRPGASSHPAVFQASHGPSQTAAGRSSCKPRQDSFSGVPAGDSGRGVASRIGLLVTTLVRCSIDPGAPGPAGFARRMLVLLHPNPTQACARDNFRDPRGECGRTGARGRPGRPRHRRGAAVRAAGAGGRRRALRRGGGRGLGPVPGRRPAESAGRTAAARAVAGAAVHERRRRRDPG